MYPGRVIWAQWAQCYPIRSRNLAKSLLPYRGLVRERYEHWLKQQGASGRAFTREQRWWLDPIAETIGINLSITPDDFDMGTFFNKGRRVAAVRLVGQQLPAILDKLNTAVEYGVGGLTKMT